MYISQFSILVSTIIILSGSCTVTKHVGQVQGWEEISSSDTSIPHKRHEAAFVGIEDKMYLIGGRRIQPISIYNPHSNTWSDGAAPPIEMHHFQPIVYRGEVYIFGAMTGQYPGETPIEDIYVYNPGQNKWRTAGSIPSNRSRGGAGVVVVGDIVYLVCGIKDGHRGDHKRWIDSYNLISKQWTQHTDAPRARDHFQATYVDGKIYAIGGRTTISSINPFKHTIGQVDIYDIKTDSWVTAANDLPTWRAGTASYVVDKEVLILGGESFTQESAHAEIEAYNTVDGTWRSLPQLPIGRHGTGIVRYGDKIYVASGCGKRGGEPELNDLWSLKY